MKKKCHYNLCLFFICLAFPSLERKKEIAMEKLKVLLWGPSPRDNSPLESGQQKLADARKQQSDKDAEELYKEAVKYFEAAYNQIKTTNIKNQLSQAYLEYGDVLKVLNST